MQEKSIKESGTPSSSDASSTVKLEDLTPAISTAAGSAIVRFFFDNSVNWGVHELRPKYRPGRSWTVDELRLKSSTDLHKLWYVCLKERNMLKTMDLAYRKHGKVLANPERADRVNETMDRIRTVILERDDAILRLETGVGAEAPKRRVTSFAGFTYEKAANEHYLPPDANPTAAQYEVPYLDDDAYTFQRLWNEKEKLKERDRADFRNLEKRVTKEHIRFKKAARATYDREEDMPKGVI